MARIARVVAPGIPHHVIHRGNRRQRVFFCDDDRSFYLELLGSVTRRYGLDVWAYCLMDNHVHLIVVPTEKSSLSAGIAEVHSCYSRRVNRRNEWRGHLWQGRFLSCPLDERHALAAMRYVERNPVCAGLVERAEEYVWSSARPHCQGISTPLLRPCFPTELVSDWRAFLAEAESEERLKRLRAHTCSGRPLGAVRFVSRLEDSLGRTLMHRRRGPKSRRKPTELSA